MHRAAIIRRFPSRLHCLKQTLLSVGQPMGARLGIFAVHPARAQPKNLSIFYIIHLNCIFHLIFLRLHKRLWRIISIGFAPRSLFRL